MEGLPRGVVQSPSLRMFKRPADGDVTSAFDSRTAAIWALPAGGGSEGVAGELRGCSAVCSWSCFPCPPPHASPPVVRVVRSTHGVRPSRANRERLQAQFKLRRRLGRAFRAPGPTDPVPCPCSAPPGPGGYGGRGRRHGVRACAAAHRQVSRRAGGRGKLPPHPWVPPCLSTGREPGKGGRGKGPAFW